MPKLFNDGQHVHDRFFDEIFIQQFLDKLPQLLLLTREANSSKKSTNVYEPRPELYMI